MFREYVLSNWSKFKLLIVLLSLLVALLGLSATIYHTFLGYLDTINPFYSDYFLGAIIGIFWAGGSGFVSLCFLYTFGKELPNKYYIVLFVLSLISLLPCVVYFIAVILSVLIT